MPRIDPHSVRAPRTLFPHLQEGAKLQVIADIGSSTSSTGSNLMRVPGRMSDESKKEDTCFGRDTANPTQQSFC